MLRHNLSVFTPWQFNHWLKTSNNMKIDVWATGERKVNCTKVNCYTWKLFLSYLQHELHQGNQVSLLSCPLKLQRTDQVGRVNPDFVSSTSVDSQKIKNQMLRFKVLPSIKNQSSEWKDDTNPQVEGLTLTASEFT